jgi:hypothetical protein
LVGSFAYLAVAAKINRWICHATDERRVGAELLMQALEARCRLPWARRLPMMRPSRIETMWQIA